MSFSTELREKTDSIWQAMFEHPMVRGIGDGTLPEAKFRFWLAQDYLYLKDYARVMALGAVRAQDLETMGWFAKLFDGIVNLEMGNHRKYAADFGVDPIELEQGEMAPTCRAYTRELLYAAHGDLADVAATLLPCLAGYAETAWHLKKKGLPDNRHYRQWIELYTSDEFVELGTYCARLLDRLADGANHDKLAHLEDLYRTSARFEYLFWQMCWEEEQWPV